MSVVGRGLVDQFRVRTSGSSSTARSKSDIMVRVWTTFCPVREHRVRQGSGRPFRFKVVTTGSSVRLFSSSSSALLLRRLLAATYEHDRGFRSTALFVYVRRTRRCHDSLILDCLQGVVVRTWRSDGLIRQYYSSFCTVAAGVTAAHAYKRTYSYDYAELCIGDETEPNGAYFFTLGTRRRQVTTKT